MATGRNNALEAIKMSQLLNKRWSEHDNSYVVMSKINNEKRKRRLAKLI